MHFCQNVTKRRISERSIIRWPTAAIALTPAPADTFPTVIYAPQYPPPTPQITTQAPNFNPLTPS